MIMKIQCLIRAAYVVTALIASAGAADLTAQSTLDTSEAQGFLGAWAMTLESPDGDVPLVLDVTDANGKLALRVGDGQQGQDVTNVSKTGDELIARYDMDYQGMGIPVILRLKMDGENLQSNWDFAEGMYVTSAVGTKR
jgi:hypothetical protein